MQKICQAHDFMRLFFIGKNGIMEKYGKIL